METPAWTTRAATTAVWITPGWTAAVWIMGRGRHRVGGRHG
jgi:hypothetical protein